MGMTAAKFKRLYESENEYQKFVKTQMKSAGIDSPQDLTKAGRKKFFNWLGTAWDEESDTVDIDGDVTDVLDDSDYAQANESVSDAALERMVREELGRVTEATPSGQISMQLERPVNAIAEAMRAFETYEIVDRLVSQLSERELSRLKSSLDDVQAAFERAGV